MPLHRWPFLALGFALAGALGVGLLRSRPPERVGGVAGTPAPVSGPADAAARPPAPPAPSGWAGGESEAAAPDLEAPPAPPAALPRASARSATPPAPAALTEAAVWSHYQPTPEELAYRAFKVEQQANKELQNLMQVLDLDESQQDRVFAALARGSSYYHPSLQPQGLSGQPVGAVPGNFQTVRPLASPPAGSAPPSSPGVPATPSSPSSPAVTDAAPSATNPADPVLAELTPEQADVYERYKSERDAFWAGVVEDVEKELNAQ